MNEEDLLYLLKHGRADDIRFIFKDIEEKSYPEDFPTFIDTMIREHKIKRKNIAIVSAGRFPPFRGCGHFLGPFTNQCPLQIKQL